MELNVVNISYELDNDEGLSLLYFEYENGYFTISRLDEDEKIYVELDDQSKGEYIDPDCYEIFFLNKKISFFVDQNRKWNLGIYQNITLLFEPLDSDKFKEMKNVLKHIFKNRL